MWDLCSPCVCVCVAACIIWPPSTCSGSLFPDQTWTVQILKVAVVSSAFVFLQFVSGSVSLIHWSTSVCLCAAAVVFSSSCLLWFDSSKPKYVAKQLQFIPSIFSGLIVIFPQTRHFSSAFTRLHVSVFRCSDPRLEVVFFFFFCSRQFLLSGSCLVWIYWDETCSLNLNFKRFYTFPQTNVRFDLWVSAFVLLLVWFGSYFSHFSVSGADDVILQLKLKLCCNSWNFIWNLFTGFESKLRCLGSVWDLVSCF